MNKYKKLALAVAISSPLVFVGCGGSSSSSKDDKPPAGETVSGTALAPGGVIAQFEPQSVFEIALNFVVTPVAAALLEDLNLKAVEGATVELIRVDDAGNQQGDVLATTATSITGDYTLTLPQGVDLAGNLVVRITGTNNNQLRAQVVEQEVDITPVSEFVLRKFIETGADLDQLVVEDVVKLNGKVEEFDLVANGMANLDQVFTALDTEVGQFLENEVAVVAGGAGDPASIAGDYRSVAFALELHDNEDQSNGSYAHDLWASSFNMADGGDSTVSITLNSEEGEYGRLEGITLGQTKLKIETYLETETETFPATLTGTGILSIEGEFEEDIDPESGVGWRDPAMTYNLVQVADKGLFFVQPNEASVRYNLTDTNNDGVADAIDPNSKAGDEIMRSLELFARTPTAFEDADLSGKFGRVYIESYLSAGSAELRTEVNTVDFKGDGTFDLSDVSNGHLISLDNTGASYMPDTDTGAIDQPVNITADGDITEIGYEDDGTTPAPADGFINDTFDFIALNDSDSSADSFSMNSQTILVKLPSGAEAPSVAGNKYRLQLMSMTFRDNEEFLLSTGKFNTFLTMASETAGDIDGGFLDVEKTGLGGSVSIKPSAAENVAVGADIASDGTTTLTIADTDGTVTMDGFFNTDASLGVFALRYADTAADPEELGLVVLIKTN